MENETDKSSGKEDESLRGKPFSEIARIVSSEAKKDTGETETELAEVRYAGMGVRIAAFLIDSVILAIPGIVVAVIMMAYEGGYFLQHLHFDVTGFFINTLYFSITESSAMQATLGKKIMNLKVIDKNGDRLTFGRALLRYLAKIISFLPLGAGILNIRNDEKCQGWHDMIAGTYVIEAK